MKSLADATALVTGASQGLGLAFAEECARRGMDTLLVALPDTGLPEVSERIATQYGTATAYLELDLSEPGAAAVLGEWVAGRRLPLRMLINNAGINAHGPFAETTVEQNGQMLGVNAGAVVQATHVLLPQLQAATPAYVLNVASVAGFGPMPYMPVYAATKAFVLSFSVALREELHAAGVHVSVVCPGGMPTNASAAAHIWANGIGGLLSAMTPRRVAHIAIERALRDKAVTVPGFLNKAVALLSALTPRARYSRSVGARFERAERRLASLTSLPGARPTAAQVGA